jgi:hypothetical protein
MVQAFEQSESIGLVSAYDLKANIVRGSGYPHGKPLLRGKRKLNRERAPNPTTPQKESKDVLSAPACSEPRTRPIL